MIYFNAFIFCGLICLIGQIILDNTNAAEQIPKDSQGLFITHDGVIFKGYLFDEKAVFDR